MHRRVQENTTWQAVKLGAQILVAQGKTKDLGITLAATFASYRFIDELLSSMNLAELDRITILAAWREATTLLNCDAENVEPNAASVLLPAMIEGYVLVD